MDVKIHDLSGNDFLSTTAKVQASEENIGKLNLIKITFVNQRILARELKKKKRQPHQVKITHKGLISGIYKELLYNSTTNSKQPKF